MTSFLRQYTIEARQVQPGDLIYNRHAYHSTAAWIRVTAVEQPDDSGYLRIHTTIYTTTLHAREGIAVRRDVGAGEAFRVRP